MAETPDGPRGNSPLSREERDRYHNRILLCPNHHTLIDKDEAQYPIERLHQIKTEHELWVQDSLGSGRQSPQEEAVQLAYGSIIDGAVESCHLDTWNAWTSWAFAPIPEWPLNLPDIAEKFARRVMAANLPGRYPDLERSLRTLARAVHEAARHFMLHAQPSKSGDTLEADQFYKRLDRWDAPEYHRRADAFDAWLDECTDLLILATKAANWFAEEVRRSVNPMFYLLEGKFLITRGPDMSLSYTTSLHEFTPEEKASMPQALIEKVKELDKRRWPARA